MTALNRFDVPSLPTPGSGPPLRAVRAALVTLPFVSVHRPSIQLGLLSAVAHAAGHECQTFHLNAVFAQMVGLELYEGLCQHRGRMLGEWLFSQAAFGEALTADADTFLERYPDALAGVPVDELHRIRREVVPAFLKRCLALPWATFEVVGFTSTFQQNNASFALAHLIQQAYPDVLRLFGGANFEGEMGLEYVRSVPAVQYAVIGAGDRAFPEFLTAVAGGSDPGSVPGVASLQGGVVRYAGDALPVPLDDLPVPDYDEYFRTVEALELLPAAPRREIWIPFESSRGCWWGQKSQCTFCGLNGSNMAFRAKRPERVLEDLRQLASRYRSFQFEAVDNIVDHTYFAKFFPVVIEQGLDYKFFYEVKSNLSRDRLKLLRQGGVARIQPGIESLSTRVLALMKKGVTAAQNVNTLRWAMYHGIEVAWNLIYGFPDEHPEDYQEQADLMRHLIHLQPPGGAGRIWMERYSPIFTDRNGFPARYISPEGSYRLIYPDSINLNRAAYFFDYELEGTLTEEHFGATHAAVSRWQSAWGTAPRPTLTYRSAGSYLQIEDLRDPSAPGTYVFEGRLAEVYLACSDQPRTPAALRAELNFPGPIEELDEALEGFCVRGLMMRDGDRVLSLALPATKER